MISVDYIIRDHTGNTKAWSSPDPSMTASFVVITMPSDDTNYQAAHDIITAYKKIGSKRLIFKATDKTRRVKKATVAEDDANPLPSTFAENLFKFGSIPVSPDIESGKTFKLILNNYIGPEESQSYQDLPPDIDNRDHPGDTLSFLSIFTGTYINRQVGFDLVPNSWYVRLLPDEIYELEMTVVPNTVAPGALYWSDDVDKYRVNYTDPLIDRTHDSGRPATTPTQYISRGTDSITLELGFPPTFNIKAVVDELIFHLEYNLEDDIDSRSIISEVVEKIRQTSG